MVGPAANRYSVTFAVLRYVKCGISLHVIGAVVPNKSLPLRSLDDGGLLQRELQLRQHPDTALVIIDTLTAVAPIHRQNGRSNAYTDDYRGYLPLRSLADRYRIPIIGSWHYNKQGSIDPMEMVSGSMGLPAVGINRLVRPSRSLFLVTLWRCGGVEVERNGSPTAPQPHTNRQEISRELY